MKLDFPVEQICMQIIMNKSITFSSFNSGMQIGKVLLFNAVSDSVASIDMHWLDSLNWQVDTTLTCTWELRCFSQLILIFSFVEFHFVIDEGKGNKKS